MSTPAGSAAMAAEGRPSLGLMSTDLEALENELRRQLEDIDSIVGESEESFLKRDAHSVFEQAAAEGEREALQDKLQILLARSEDFELQQVSMRELILRNEELMRENSLLRKFRDDYVEEQKAIGPAGATAIGKTKHDLDESFKDLEFRLAEARSKLARALQSQDDHLLARELAEKRLEQEKLARSHAEKERDAYAAAYEASLKHFEKWSQRKIGTSSTEKEN